MQEGEPNPNRGAIAARVEVGIGFAGAAVSAITAIDPEKVIDLTANIPTSMGRVLLVAQEAGIPPLATLIALTAFFTAIYVDGVRRLRRL